MKGSKCLVCRISQLDLLAHLQTHSPKVLAEELLRITARSREQERTISHLREEAKTTTGCSKKRYRTEADATAALLKAWEQAAQGDDRRQEQRSYLCRWCGCWHLTSAPLRPHS